MILAFTADLEERGSIRSLTVGIMKLHESNVIAGVQTFDFNRPRLTFKCQCNTDGNIGFWYGGEWTMKFETPSQKKELDAIYRKAMKENNGTSDTEVLRSIGLKMTHVYYDGRFNYIPALHAEELKDVRAWYDVGASTCGRCTVHAYTNHSDPSREVVEAAIKKAFCDSGEADALIRWNESGKKFREIAKYHNHKDPMPFSEILDFPKTFCLEEVES